MIDQSDEFWKTIPRKYLAATLLILYDGPTEKQVVLTVRALNMRSYPGEAALPGGKVDGSEDWWETAFREAKEEIGFDASLFEIEKLVALPAHLSRHYLFVRPCAINIKRKDGSPVQLEDIAPKLNADEVLCVFSVELSRFLKKETLNNDPVSTPWGGSPWYFYVFGFTNKNWIFANEKEKDSIESTTVTGLTAHMLIDCARYVYQRSPDFAHLEQLGFLVGVEYALTTGRFISRI